MELSSYARQILAATTLDGKLAAPAAEMSDDDPGSGERPTAPARPPELAIDPMARVRVPPLAGMADRSQRIRILHAMANHELQAAELFAWAILAFPNEPAAFRRGLLHILVEEQLHCRLYIERLEALGSHFGAYPVTSHFWKRIDAVKTPLDFVCTMGLTFENANLDFAIEYAEAARNAGDDETARVLDRVHEDEIRHVAFAWRWFQRNKPEDASDWDAFEESLEFPLDPGRARGRTFYRDSREAAGLGSEFIDRLEGVTAMRPNGTPR